MHIGFVKENLLRQDRTGPAVLGILCVDPSGSVEIETADSRTVRIFCGCAAVTRKRGSRSRIADSHALHPAQSPNVRIVLLAYQASWHTSNEFGLHLTCILFESCLENRYPVCAFVVFLITSGQMPG